MGYILAELVVESVLRDGLKELRNDPDKIDDIFTILGDDSLGTKFTQTKYGQAELNKLKKFFTTKEVAVVHSFHQVINRVPCISIQLASEQEAPGLQSLGDFHGDVEELLNEEELQDKVIISSMTTTAYDSQSGIVSVDDSADMSKVYVNALFVDSSGNEFKILGAIDNTDGQKKFAIEAGLTNVNLGSGSIKSFILNKFFEEAGTISEEQLLIGIHTEQELLTKYLYTAVKAIFQSRKVDLIRRGLKRIKFSGSDFTRNLQYEEPIFTRFLTLSGITENRVAINESEPIDNLEITVLVEKDEKDNEDIGITDQTVQVTDE